VDGLESFTMPFNPGGPSPYAGQDLQYYYRPVPDLAVADLGRSAGYTLRPEGFGIAFPSPSRSWTNCSGRPSSAARNEHAGRPTFRNSVSAAAAAPAKAA
jgi:hypothetical protein